MSSLHLFDLPPSLCTCAVCICVCVHMQRPEEVVWCPVYHFLSGFPRNLELDCGQKTLSIFWYAREHPSPPHQLWSYRCPVLHDHAQLCGGLSLGLHVIQQWYHPLSHLSDSALVFDLCVRKHPQLSNVFSFVSCLRMGS